MRNAESLSQEQIREFLQSSQPIEFAGCGRDEKYGWVERVLGAQNYGGLSKPGRGVVRAYVRKVTGMSAAQTTRLIRVFLDHGVVRAAPYQRHRFRARYTSDRDRVFRNRAEDDSGTLAGRSRRFVKLT